LTSGWIDILEKRKARWLFIVIFIGNVLSQRVVMHSHPWMIAEDLSGYILTNPHARESGDKSWGNLPLDSAILLNFPLLLEKGEGHWQKSTGPWMGEDCTANSIPSHIRSSK
jgi:hypothetical protein